MPQVQNHARYFIVNAKGGTVMDLSGADNRSVIGYPSHGGKKPAGVQPRTNWETIHTDEGWLLRNVDRETYLAVDGELRDDARLIAQDEKFTWHLWDDKENPSAVRICVPNTQLNADLTEYGSAQPGTPIAVWGRWNGDNQTWFFEKVDD